MEQPRRKSAIPLYAALLLIGMMAVYSCGYGFQARVGSSGAMVLHVRNDVGKVRLLAGHPLVASFTMACETGEACATLRKSDYQLELDLAASASPEYRTVKIKVQRQVQDADGFVDQSSPQMVAWQQVFWDIGGKSYHATATGCVYRPESAACRFVEKLLSRPTLAAGHDVQPWVVAFSRHVLSRLVPAVIASMLLLDGGLFCLCLWYLIRWWRGLSLGRRVLREALGATPDAVPQLMHYEHLAVGRRRLLEWCEVTGPALGFLLTVGALLLAFDPSVFEERNTVQFTEAISLAMTATFAGLLLRILAFSADRLLEHLLRMDDDGFGYVTTRPATRPEGS